MFTKSFMASLSSPPIKTLSGFFKSLIAVPSAKNSGFERTEKLVKELQGYVKGVTAPYKYPRKIEFVESLPKTVSGKIRRIELRNKEWRN